MTPYEIVYGQRLPFLPIYEAGTTKLDMVDRSLQDRNCTLSLSLSFLKANLEAAQVCVKQQTNENRVDRSFNVGDKVFLRLVPYQHQSLASHPFHELQPRFYGPFKILGKVNLVVYKLKLPPHLELYPIFHVSCLKALFGVVLQLPCLLSQMMFLSKRYQLEFWLIKLFHMMFLQLLRLKF